MEDGDDEETTHNEDIETINVTQEIWPRPPPEGCRGDQAVQCKYTPDHQICDYQLCDGNVDCPHGEDEDENDCHARIGV